MSSTVTVLVTGAAGQIAYSLIPIICRGDVFGQNTPLNLKLLDIEPMRTVLEGVEMEIDDCCYPLLRSIGIHTNEKEAFTDVDAAFLVGAMPRRQGMERKDLLAANVKIFASQGRLLSECASENVRVLVVGNPANTNALICAKFAGPRIPPTSITAMTRLDQNRTVAQLAKQFNVSNDDVQQVIIWGNHSSTQFPDISNATINGKRINFQKHDPDLVKLIQTRGAAVIEKRKLSSAMSAAKAAADHMRDWWQGSNGQVVSMGVYTDGQHYGVESDLVVSLPVKVDPATKQWTIVDGFSHDAVGTELFTKTVSELKEEKQEALSVTQTSQL